MRTTILVLMRSYFIRVPQWARSLYSQAIWSYEEPVQFPNHQITIDDGPHQESTLKWLNLLDHRERKAIFFLRADHAVANASLVQEIKDRGHYIGSHGFNHLNGWRTPTHQYIDDLKKSMDVLETCVFRPPYGRMTYSQYREARKLTDIVMWSVMPGDFDLGVDAEVMNKRLQDITRNDIIVFHDSPSSFAKASKVLLQHSFVDQN